MVIHLFLFMIFLSTFCQKKTENLFIKCLIRHLNHDFCEKTNKKYLFDCLIDELKVFGIGFDDENINIDIKSICGLKFIKKLKYLETETPQNITFEIRFLKKTFIFIMLFLCVCTFLVLYRNLLFLLGAISLLICISFDILDNVWFE